MDAREQDSRGAKDVGKGIKRVRSFTGKGWGRGRYACHTSCCKDPKASVDNKATPVSYIDLQLFLSEKAAQIQNH